MARTTRAGETNGPVSLVATGVGKAIDGSVLLRPTDLAVRSGECVVLRGENGSGKTTLLRILAGMTTPTDGKATLDGTVADERDPAMRRTVAALLGAPTAYRDLTLVEHQVVQQVDVEAVEVRLPGERRDHRVGVPEQLLHRPQQPARRLHPSQPVRLPTRPWRRTRT